MIAIYSYRQLVINILDLQVIIIYFNAGYMADVAQLVRASDCGSEGRGFKPRLSPHLLKVL